MCVCVCVCCVCVCTPLTCWGEACFVAGKWSSVNAELETPILTDPTPSASFLSVNVGVVEPQDFLAKPCCCCFFQLRQNEANPFFVSFLRLLGFSQTCLHECRLSSWNGGEERCKYLSRSSKSKDFPRSQTYQAGVNPFCVSRAQTQSYVVLWSLEGFWDIKHTALPHKCLSRQWALLSARKRAHVATWSLILQKCLIDLVPAWFNLRTTLWVWIQVNFFGSWNVHIVGIAALTKVKEKQHGMETKQMTVDVGTHSLQDSQADEAEVLGILRSLTISRKRSNCWLSATKETASQDSICTRIVWAFPKPWRFVFSESMQTKVTNTNQIRNQMSWL